MAFTDQSAFEVRCEWGVAGVGALAGCRTFVVIDVLSFSTCVSVAAARGVTIVPGRFRDGGAEEEARRQGARLAGARGAGYSLSPASFLAAPPGLRVLLPSPNGAGVALAAHGRGHVLAACLRNRAAVAARAAALGGPFAVVPGGERWPDGSLRPAFEDLLGAGAIAALLPGTRSPEAAAAVAVFEANAAGLLAALRASASGRELIEKGFPDDVELAADLDADTVAPELVEGAFTASATTLGPRWITRRMPGAAPTRAGAGSRTAPRGRPAPACSFRARNSGLAATLFCTRGYNQRARRRPPRAQGQAVVADVADLVDQHGAQPLFHGVAHLGLVAEDDAGDVEQGAEGVDAGQLGGQQHGVEESLRHAGQTVDQDLEGQRRHERLVHAQAEVAGRAHQQLGVVLLLVGDDLLGLILGLGPQEVGLARFAHHLDAERLAGVDLAEHQQQLRGRRGGQRRIVAARTGGETAPDRSGRGNPPRQNPGRPDGPRACCSGGGRSPCRRCGGRENRRSCRIAPRVVFRLPAGKSWVVPREKISFVGHGLKNPPSPDSYHVVSSWPGERALGETGVRRWRA